MDSKKKLGQAAGTIGGMTLISRLLGFIRDLAIAMQFGATSAADAFFVAFRIPNVQRKILSEGAVTAAFIPVFTEMRNINGEEDAWKMTAKLFNILLAVLITSSLASILFTPFIGTIFAPGFI